TYENCPSDCKKPIICGDGICEGNETYENCPSDCKKPIICGDGICEGNETYENCPSDCKKPIICGDGICEGNETCETCEQDCGKCNYIIYIPSKVKEGEKFKVKVTTVEGKPVKDVFVKYGNLGLYTNSSGEVEFIAFGDVLNISINKGDYKEVKILNVEKKQDYLPIILGLILLIILLFLIL
ncbi:MAG: hypothetical protein ACK4YO_04095, partial [Candidatus Altarchaeaceae archaeon]